MFQEKKIEAYKKIKAPVELKNRIALSIKKKKQKQRAAIAAAAAGFALFFLTNGWLDDNSTVLYVNNAAVSYQAVEIVNNQNRGISMLSSEQENPIMVPLEINVQEKACITVSEGMLQRIVEEEETPVNQLEILEKTVVYWILDADTVTNPVCTITVGKETYQYLIAYQTGASAFTIRKMK